MKRINKNTYIGIGLSLLFTFSMISCREDIVIAPPVSTQVDSTQTKTEYSGFYLLNEGNMGSNKSTLDYYDYSTGFYTKNIYASVNPTVTKELGDVGNDLQIYGMRRPEICLQFFVYNPAIVLHLIFIFVLSYSSGVGLC